jgi:hypothetical protein
MHSSLITPEQNNKDPNISCGSISEPMVANAQALVLLLEKAA